MMNVDSMLGQNHDIYHEFPEHREAIDNLRAQDAEFSRLCDEYTALNREVIRIEQHLDPKDHYYFEETKKKRLHAKDLIYRRLAD